jgi:hypothetical protein
MIYSTYIDLKIDHLIVFAVNARLTDHTQMYVKGGRVERGGLVLNSQFGVLNIHSLGHSPLESLQIIRKIYAV